VIWILGAILGVYLGRLLSLYTEVKISKFFEKDYEKEYYSILANNVFFAALGAALGISIGFRYKKFISRAGTAILGAYFLVRGIAVYVKNFPMFFKVEEMGEFDANYFKDTDNKFFFYTWGYVVGFVLLFFFGTCFQYKMFPPKRKVSD
jgi:hypothetical protein